MNPADVLRNVIEQQLTNVNTCLPSTIINFNSDERKATVKPDIKIKLQDGTIFDQPELNNVPVMFPNSTEFSMTWPLNAGDKVLVVFSQRSIDQWKDNGDQREPSDPRKFDMSDGFAIPMLTTFNNVISNDNENFVIQFGQSKLKISPTGRFSFCGLNDELIDLFSETLTLLRNFQGASAGGPVTADPSYILQVQALKSRIDIMKGTC